METIKSRLLPLLQTSFSSVNMGKVMETEIRPIQVGMPRITGHNETETSKMGQLSKVSSLGLGLVTFNGQC